MGRGRPPGSRNKKSLAVDRLLAQYSAPLVKKCIAMAMNGDPTAMRLCMERLGAPKRENHVKLKTLPAETMGEVKQSLACTIAAVSTGKIAPSQGEVIARMLEVQRRGIESAELEVRVGELENLTPTVNSK